MKIYMLETMGDYLYQCGCSLNKQLMKEVAEKKNKESKNHKFWVTEYEIDNKHYTEFEDY